MKISISNNQFNQLLAVIPVNLIMFMVGFGGGIAPVLSWLSQRLSISETAMIASLYFVGRAIGPFVQWGLIDRRGRNVLFVTSSLLLCLQYGVLLSNAEDAVYAHYVARVSLGLASGILQSTMGTYVGENCSPSSRGVFVSIIFLHNSLGVLTAFVLSTYCSYTVLNSFAAAVSLLSLVSSVCLLREPAHFLLMRGRAEEAERNWAWLRGTTEDACAQFNEIRDHMKRERDHEHKSTCEKMASPEARLGIAVLMVLTLLLALTGSQAVDVYITIIFKNSKFISPSKLTIIYAVMRLVTLLVGTAVIEKFNRRTLLVFISVVMTVTFLAAAAIFMIAHHMYIPYMYVLKFSILTIGIAISNGLPLLGAVKSELLPQHVKGIGSALAIVVGAFGGFFSLRSFLPIKAEYGIEYNFFMNAFFSVVLLFFVYFYQPETRGKTLVQIQNELRRTGSCKLVDDPATVPGDARRRHIV